MKNEPGWNLLRLLVGALLIAGIVTGALNVTVGGFTPLLWLLLALVFVVIITCHEVLMIRTFLVNKW
jgi:hypothetical protein